MLMPAVGFVVVPSDCLGAHVARRLPAARRLAIGISRTDLVSRGSAKTLLAAWSDSIAIRRGGRLAAVPAGTLERCFDYGRGPSGSAAVSWGDVVTAHHTTGIADVETYLEVSPSERAMFRSQRSVPAAFRSAPVRRLLELQTKLLPEGPDVRRRAAARRVIVAEASDSAGRCARARLTTPEAYSFTAASALAVVERVLGGDFRPGFQTPALVYGPDFVLGIEGVVREDTA
jgi:short subunit dehydrogenase-like uncharacterized protein